MPPSDNGAEAETQEWSSQEDSQTSSEEMARPDVVKASSDYQVACQTAVRANRLEFEVTDGNTGDLSDSDSMANSSSDEDYDDSSAFDECTMSAIVRPDGDLPSDCIATLRMAIIAENQVDIATFRDDILETVLEVEPLGYDILDHHGKFRSDYWGRGSANEGTGVWGSEFGRGLLVFMDDVDVKHSLRGMGVGTRLFKQALDWVNKKANELGQPAEACRYLVAAPGSLRQDVIREFGEGDIFTGGYGERQAEVDAFMKKQAEKSIAFLRKQGFRRVGLSHFWGYATASNHPSRQLTAEEDSKRDDMNPPSFTAW